MAGTVMDCNASLTQKTKGKAMTTEASVDTRTQILEPVSPGEVAIQPEANPLIKIMAIVTPLLSFGVQNWFVLTMGLLSGEMRFIGIAMLTGNLMGMFLMPLIVMLLFQIGKRFRNPRSRWSIFFYTGLFFLVVNILSAIGRVLSN